MRPPRVTIAGCPGTLVGFGCSPDNAGKLTDAVFALIEEVKKTGLDQPTVEKLREQRKRGLETDLKLNEFWVRQLEESYRYGTDPRKILELGEQIERIASDGVKRAAKQYLGKQWVDALLVPEATAAAANGGSGKAGVAGGR